MGKKAGTILLAVLLFSAIPLKMSAGSDSYTVVDGPKNFYYGHVSNIDGKEGPEPYILRENGARRIPAVINMPLMPGDSIVTSDGYRLEIQFDNGTILRLDKSSEIKIETILADSLTTSKKMTNLVLSRGQAYTMFKEYSASEIFQFLLPTAAVRMRHNTVAILGVGEDKASDIRVRYGKADVLYGADVKASQKQTVFKGEWITIGPDHRYALQPFSEGTPFENWNVSMNDHFETLHEGVSTLPKPIRRLPLAVQNFAEKFGDLYGEWIYDDYLGYVWRPGDNDRALGKWQPYFYGQWTMAGNQMYWVPGETWGWVPYHLGVWQWDKKRGWLWIPGSAFAPAWVDWDFFKGNYYAWRPYSLWDWVEGYDGYWNTSVSILNEGSDAESLYPNESESMAEVRTTNKVTKAQLASPSRSAYKMPREFKGQVKALQKGLDKKDSILLASLREKPGVDFVISDKHMIRERSVSLKTFPVDAESGRTLPSEESVRRTRVESRPEGGSATPSKTSELSGRPRPGTPAILRESAPRFRDWNPDIRLAVRYGVSIEYDSRSNQVYSPELQMRSGDRWTPNHFLSRGETGGFQQGGGTVSGDTGISTDRSAAAAVAPSRTASNDDRTGESRANPIK